MLHRMLRRDLWHLRGQVLAAALVVACGVAALVATRGTYRSLLVAQRSYYETYRFADVFAHLTRAPESLAAEIAEIPGVARLNTRVVVDVNLDVPGLAEPATGRLVSMPATHRPELNDVHLLRGRYLGGASSDEVLASDAFARANGLQVGDRLAAVLNGRWKELTIVGIAMSPEYVYEVSSGMLFPDNRRFGVLWISRDEVAAAFRMEGAFNDLTLSLSRDADEAEVLSRLDRLLERYGGLSAYGRSEQASSRFLNDELGEIRIMTTFVPTLFLGVAAFLLYVVLSRLVAMQRSEVGLLKAFGRSNRAIGIHYLSFAIATALLGLGLGLPLGRALGKMFVRVYEDYFHFPHLTFSVSPALLLFASFVSLMSASVGALSAVSRAVRLAPAEAMRPEAPARFRPGLLERMGGLTLLPPSLRIIVRNVGRRPVRAACSVLGIAFAVGLMVVGRFTLDAASHMMTVQFERLQHDDLTVLLNEPRDESAAFELARLPGVRRAEPFRSVPVWLHHGHRAKRVEITGLPTDRQLRELVDGQLRPVDLPPEGLLLGTKLAKILTVAPGDSLEVDVLEGRRAKLTVPVTGVVDEMLGLGAYMDRTTLSRWLGEGPMLSGACLALDPARSHEVYTQLKRMPRVSGVAVRSAMMQTIEDTLDRSFSFFSVILVAFASVIVMGMVYNSVRISLSERGNELASLRVLGFTQREVAVILLGEHALLTVLAIPLGLGVGYALCALLVPAFDRETFRLPLVLGKWAFAYPVLAALGAAAVSGLLVARRLTKLDLIAVLKTRE